MHFESIPYGIDRDVNLEGVRSMGNELIPNRWSQGILSDSITV